MADRRPTTIAVPVAGLYLLLVICIGLSNAQILFSNKEDSSDYIYDSGEPTASHCHERYVSKSYFTEHGTLQDSSFDDFICRLPKGCNGQVVVSVLDLHHNLIGEGSHRHLSLYLRYSIERDAISDSSVQRCEIIVIECLPCGVFADPFEYQHLTQRGVFKDAAVFGDTNLELPSFLSSRTLVEVHIEAKSSVAPGQNVFREMKIELPVHARCPPLEKGGYSRIEFVEPVLFLRCGIEGRKSSQNCSLTLITGLADPQNNAVSWSIPAGIETHARVVSVITFASAILSAILIIMASLRHRGIGSYGLLKQS